MKLRLPGSCTGRLSITSSPAHTSNRFEANFETNNLTDTNSPRTVPFEALTNNNNTNKMITRSSSFTSLKKKSSCLFDSPRKVLKKKKQTTKPKEEIDENRQEQHDPSSLLRNFDNLPFESSPRDVTVVLASRDVLKMNVLEWLRCEAPQDIVPKVLSFLGSRKIAALSRTCKSWREMALSDAVWRTVSEDLHKWKTGDETPKCWLTFYRDNPCVPIDFDTIESALQSASNDDDKNAGENEGQQNRSIRILLCPGKYFLHKSITVDTVLNSSVTIETLDVPLSNFVPSLSTLEEQPKTRSSSRDASPNRRRSCRIKGIPSASSLRGLLICRGRSSSALMDDGVTAADHLDPTSSHPNYDSYYLPYSHSHSNKAMAMLVLNTRHNNEPIIRLKQGKLNINNVHMIHNCNGTDIWNGNAAVQLQPPFDPDNDTTIVMNTMHPFIQPTANLSRVNITSISGRGVVAIDGAHVLIQDSYIHSCAATGLYVGGPGSVATIERTDVLNNGHGNETNRRGIARGHSGIYLEQGTADIHDCNISDNSLTGISAVSPDNAMITIEDSDLRGNGSIQLELPPNGTVSRSRSVTNNNVVMQEGTGRVRSGLVQEDELLEGVANLTRDRLSSNRTDELARNNPALTVVDNTAHQLVVDNIFRVM